MLYGSKETTEKAVNILTKLLQLSNQDNTFIGGMVAMFHIIFGLYTLNSICFQKIDNMFTYIILAWILIIVSNYYFHGCILTRLERSLYDNKNWYGPASLLLDALKIDQNKDNANKTIKYLIAFPFSVILILRLLFSKNYCLFLVMFCMLTPLLFIHSQALLFNNDKQTSLDTSNKNKNVIVSGASSGIGFAFVKELLRNHANVICLMRDSKQAQDNYNELHKIYGEKIRWVKADFTSLKTIQTAVEDIKLIYADGIDILFNNAGISNTKPKITDDGYEAQIQTNCVSHIALTEGLLSLITKRKGIILNHSSMSYNIPSNIYNHVFFRKHENLNAFNGLFITQHLYQQSKLGLVLYTGSLQNRLKDTDVRVISFHPGVCKTNLFNSSVLPQFLIKIIDLFANSVTHVVPCITECISSSSYKDPAVIYGLPHISVDKNIVNSQQTDLFEHDVVSTFITSR